MALNLRALFGAGHNASTTSVNVSNASTSVLLAANLNRKGFIVVNTAGTLFVRLDGLATSTLFSKQLGAGETWEVANYTGSVTARKSSGTTAVLVTEII